MNNKFRFMPLRSFIATYYPSLVNDFNRITSSVVSTRGNVKVDLVETTNNLLSKISNNDKLFDAVQRWKYAVLLKAQRWTYGEPNYEGLV